MSLFFTLLAVAVRRCQDTTRAFFPFTSRGNGLLIAIISTSTFIFLTLIFTQFSFVITQNYNYSILLHGLEIIWFMGVRGFELCDARGGVLDIFEHAKLDRNGKLISQHNYIVVQ